MVLAPLLLAAALAAPPSTHPVDHPRTRPSMQPAKPDAAPPAGSRPAPDAGAIRAVITQLNHPSLTRRRAAIRQLAEWGPVAFPELRAAARGSNLEAALSARDLLRELESAILIGARVRLEADKRAIAWNEPLTLTVYAENVTPGPLLVPWPEATSPKHLETPTNSSPASRPAAPGSQPSADDARQVAGMMDAADFLIVTGPDGEELDLRVEPIDRDPDVYRAVDVRARDNPPSHLVPPGETSRLDIPLFNRGWARYPMLAPGRYSIAFAYQPKWRDESWTESQFGLVRAEPIVIEVTTAAPEVIRGDVRPLGLAIRRAGDNVEAVIQSYWDFPLWINLNIGGDTMTHAMINWRIDPATDGAGEPVDVPVEDFDPVFHPDRFARIEPGASSVISRVPVSRLLRAAREAGKSPPDVSVVCRYVYLASATKLRERLADLRQPAHAPVHLFSGVLASEPMLLKELEK